MSEDPTQERDETCSSSGRGHRASLTASSGNLLPYGESDER